MPVTSASWKASLPSIGVMVWPVSTIIGTESISAVSSPVTVLVAPGPEVTRATPDPPGGTGVSVGHVGRALLMTHENELHLRVDQRVEDRHGRPTGQPEHDIHPFALQALDDFVPAGGHLLRLAAAMIGKGTGESAGRADKIALSRTAARLMSRFSW